MSSSRPYTACRRALSEKQGVKSFYYQAGLLERTEGFILLSLMLALTGYLIPLTYAFVALAVFTGLQRLHEARRLLGWRFPTADPRAARRRW